MTQVIEKRLAVSERAVLHNESRSSHAEQRDWLEESLRQRLQVTVLDTYGLYAHLDDFVIRVVDITTPEDTRRQQVTELEFRALWQPDPQRGVVMHFGHSQWPILFTGLHREWKSGFAPTDFTIVDQQKPEIVPTVSPHELFGPRPLEELYHTRLVGIDANLGILVYSDRPVTNGKL